MRLSTASLALAALLAAPAITMVPSALAGRDRTPEQDNVLFEARKTWSKDNYQRRLDLLQSHQRCIDAAASREAMKSSAEKARKSLKQDYRAYMNKVWNKLGLPARAGNPNANGRRLQA